MSVYFRGAHEDEMDALLALYQHLHATDAPLPDNATLRATWSALLHAPGMHCLVAESDGELVASCVLAIIPNLTRGARPYGLIENVVTHAAHRRRGIGRALMQHAMELAWSEGCYKVMLMTSSKEEAVHRFYRQAGFDGGEKTGYVARP